MREHRCVSYVESNWPDWSVLRWNATIIAGMVRVRLAQLMNWQLEPLSSAVPAGKRAGV